MRPSFDVYMMRLAYLVASRATCPRKHVGSVIVTPDHRIVSTGYNGAPRGMLSCDDIGCLMHDGHCTRSLHAESNAIDFAGREAQGCDLYVNVSPCWDCAKRIVQAGISRVAYDSFYASRYGKSTEVVDYLKTAGVQVFQFETYVMTQFKAMMAMVDAVPSEAQHGTSALPVEYIPPKISPESCAIHRFQNDVCVICGLKED